MPAWPIVERAAIARKLAPDCLSESIGGANKQPPGGAGSRGLSGHNSGNLQTLALSLCSRFIDSSSSGATNPTRLGPSARGAGFSCHLTWEVLTSELHFRARARRGRATTTTTKPARRKARACCPKLHGQQDWARKTVDAAEAEVARPRPPSHLAVRTSARICACVIQFPKGK